MKTKQHSVKLSTLIYTVPVQLKKNEKYFLSPHSVEKSSKTRSRFLRKNQHFFRQINVFTKEVTKELISRNLSKIDRVL